MIPADSLDTLCGPLLHAQHVLIVCRNTSFSDVSDGLEEIVRAAMDPVKIVYARIDDSGGEVMFDNDSCLFVRHDITDKMLTIMSRQAPNLHIYIV